MGHGRVSQCGVRRIMSIVTKVVLPGGRYRTRGSLWVHRVPVSQGGQEAVEGAGMPPALQIASRRRQECVAADNFPMGSSACAIIRRVRTGAAARVRISAMGDLWVEIPVV